MDKLTDYPKLIERILTNYISLCNRNPNRPLETFLIIDRDTHIFILTPSSIECHTCPGQGTEESSSATAKTQMPFMRSSIAPAPPNLANNTLAPTPPKTSKSCTKPFGKN